MPSPTHRGRAVRPNAGLAAVALVAAAATGCAPAAIPVATGPAPAAIAATSAPATPAAPAAKPGPALKDLRIDGLVSLGKGPVKGATMKAVDVATGKVLPLVAAGAGNLVAAGAGNLVAAGAGNLVAAGAGNLVAAGAGNYRVNQVGAFLTDDAGRFDLVVPGLRAGQVVKLVASFGDDSLVTLVAGSGKTLAGGGLVAAGAGNLVAAGAGNLVAAGAGNLVAAGAGNLVAAGGMNYALLQGARDEDGDRTADGPTPGNGRTDGDDANLGNDRPAGTGNDRAPSCELNPATTVASKSLEGVLKLEAQNDDGQSDALDAGLEGVFERAGDLVEKLEDAFEKNPELEARVVESLDASGELADVGVFRDVVEDTGLAGEMVDLVADALIAFKEDLADAPAGDLPTDPSWDKISADDFPLGDFKIDADGDFQFTTADGTVVSGTAGDAGFEQNTDQEIVADTPSDAPPADGPPEPEPEPAPPAEEPPPDDGGEAEEEKDDGRAGGTIDIRDGQVTNPEAPEGAL